MNGDDIDLMLKEMLNPDKEYLSDDGFTGRVLEKLPAAAPRPWLRYAILTAFTAIAAIFVLFVSPGYTVVSNAVIDVTTAIAQFHVPSPVSTAVMGIFIAGALVPVFSASRRKF
jgi:hypothetical protein